ncbi:MAG: S-layer homology domain-containing protein [Clostridia bacterium]|nr:S-layer homology domain-containing protein [Clostridia bacterium]
MSKRITALIFALLLTFVQLCSAVTVGASSNDHKVYTAYDLNNGYLALADLKPEVLDEGGPYLHLVAKAGTYGNNNVMLSFTDNDFKVFDYPIIRIEYRTNVNNKDFLDTTLHHKGGENWPSAHPKKTADGKWHSAVIDANTISLPADVVADKTQAGIVVRYKPWGGGNKALEEEQYFDIRFIGFFKNVQDANSFKFSKKEADAAYDKYFGDTGFINPDGKPELDKLNAEIDAHIEKIKNTPTSVTVTGTKYYVSSSGDDSKDGLTPETAWRTIKKVDEFKFKAGDGVFFKRGDSFRADGVTLTLQSGVTYSAYGEGDKPVLVGSKDGSNALEWFATDVPNVYRYSVPLSDVGCIVFDGGRAWGVRMGPAAEGKSIDSGVVHNGIDEPYQSGGGIWDSYRSLTNNLEFCNANGYVYLYSKDGNPAEIFENVEILWNYHGVNGGGLENVVFDNIKLFGYGAHGISTSNVKNFTIQNCVFGWIGGSGHRYGNAIQNWENSENFIIDMCYTYQAYDCAYTNQINDSSGNGKTVNIIGMKYTNNVAERCNTGLEVWNAASVTNYKDCYLTGNYVRDAGYGWSHQRPNKDGNFYYGAYFGNVPTWENYHVSNNKFAVTYAYGLVSKHIAPDNAYFHDNLYIIQRGKNYARSATGYLNASGPATSYSYNDYTMEKLTRDGVDKGSKFYFLEEDYVPEAFDYKNAKDIYPSGGFIDTNGHWAKDYIDFTVGKGLYNGVTNSEFAPDMFMTRAMFMTVLARYDNAALEAGTKWYDGAVKWAVDNKIAEANGADPDASISRAEMAVMIKNYLDYKCIEYSTPALTFADADRMQNDLKDAVSVCVGAGIISGYDDNTFKSTNNSTRAQVAAVFTRLDTFLSDAKPDIESLVAAKKAFVYDAATLNDVLFVSTANATKELVDDEGISAVRFTPSVAKGTVQINMLQSRFKDGVDFYRNGYVRMKLKVVNGASKMDIGLRWNQEQWLDANGPFRPVCPNGEWSDSIVAIHNFTGNEKAKTPSESLSTYFYTFKPWGNNSQIPAGAYFEIEKIGFFTDENTARNVDF